MSDRKASAIMEKNGKVATERRASQVKAESADNKDLKDSGKEAGAGGVAQKEQSKTSPKKRRKVNHACVYCRRSHMTCDLERPCTRCIKRNIGHLCHDEPREPDAKKPKNGKDAAATDNVDVQNDATSLPTTMGPPPSFDGRSSSGFGAGGVGGALGQGNTLSLVQPGGASALQGNALNNSAGGNANQFAGFSEEWNRAQNFQDMNHYNRTSYMVAPEVSHEFNLLDDFFQSSLLDDNALQADDSLQNNAFGRTGQLDMLPQFGNGGNGLTAAAPNDGGANRSGGTMAPPPSNIDGKTRSSTRKSNATATVSTAVDKDKTREYYLQAADPSGNDNPEQRMSRVLKAKYDAGLLKPFNYINGYSRLGKYLDGHIAASSKQKIIRTINHFRPKFREKAQGLTDMQLVYVEMWFEKQLMEYDRVFASMAVPACCWRRTGEIFRGNKEMAELINVPVDQLRDGKIALHEILTEESMVRYWEEFGTIAFDPAHDTLLTACSLKNPSDTSDHPIVKCCFSFTIRRDEHKLPALIVGNFLPHDPPSN